MQLYNKEPSYQITEKTIKMGFINYKQIISLVEANSILDWARMHSYMIHKMQQLSLTLNHHNTYDNHQNGYDNGGNMQGNYEDNYEEHYNEQQMHLPVVVNNHVMHHHYEDIHHHVEPEMEQKEAMLDQKIEHLKSIESRIDDKMSMLESKLNLFNQPAALVNTHIHDDHYHLQIPN